MSWGFPKTWQTNKIVCVTVIRLTLCESTVGSHLGLLRESTDILCKCWVSARPKLSWAILAKWSHFIFAKYNAV